MLMEHKQKPGLGNLVDIGKNNYCLPEFKSGSGVSLLKVQTCCKIITLPSSAVQTVLQYCNAGKSCADRNENIKTSSKTSFMLKKLNCWMDKDEEKAPYHQA